MQVKDILALEIAKRRSIVLLKEGLFWRAYNRSAFLFVHHFRPIKLIKKYVKTVQQEIVYVGFPNNQLEVIIQMAKEKGKAVDQEEKQVVINMEADLDSAAYTQWFASLEEERKAIVEKGPLTSNLFNGIIEKIRSYTILEKSPLETQQFVLEIQKEINGIVQQSAGI